LNQVVALRGQVACEVWILRRLKELRQVSIVQPGKFHPVPGNETLEYQISPDSGLMRVRRRKKVPTPEEQQRTPTTRVLGIIDDEEAHARGAVPAYYRTISTCKVTFTCLGCKQTVTQERLPGSTLRYCSDTRQGEARRGEIGGLLLLELPNGPRIVKTDECRQKHGAGKVSAISTMFCHLAGQPRKPQHQ
jgi:hypothetical protein